MSSPQQFARVGEDSAGFSQFSSNKYLVCRGPDNLNTNKVSSIII